MKTKRWDFQLNQPAQELQEREERSLMQGRIERLAPSMDGNSLIEIVSVIAEFQKASDRQRTVIL
jgi:adenylylsulfate kinase-like enzyme